MVYGSGKVDVRLLHTRLLFILLAALSMISIAAALDVPQLSGRVNDQANLLSSEARARISSSLQQLEKEKGAQVAVLTLPSLQGEPLEDYSIRVAEAWQLGRKGIDDGLLLLVARDERKIRIEVGYGLEGILTDLDSRRIIDNLMVPAFRSGNYEKGIEAAVAAIKGKIMGETDAIPGKSSSSDIPNGGIGFLGFFAFFLFPFAKFAVALKGRQGWTLYLFLAPFFYFIPLMLGPTAALISIASWLIIVGILRLIWPEKWRIDPGSSDEGGGWFSGGGSGYSGGGGGGFSGGGGSFGGGGASGSW